MRATRDVSDCWPQTIHATNHFILLLNIINCIDSLMLPITHSRHRQLILDKSIPGNGQQRQEFGPGVNVIYQSLPCRKKILARLASDAH